VTAALAGLAYGWGMGGASVETFYAAAARSMSQSWHDFIFGAFDPAGTVTVDKLPGALWAQALSLRLFGFGIWALVLPQVIEGVLTVLVLYRAVRRLAGPVAGLAAAVALAATPVTVLLGRGNVSDSLLILLLVLAADATAAALSEGRLRWLLLAGVWAGLAFQAKMVQAWLVLPGLAAAYLMAAPAERWRTRVGHVAAAGLVTVLVSLSWMTAVSLVPPHDRPYVDGTRDDSVYEQVFDYNGLARVSGNPLTSAGPPAPFLLTLVRHGQTLNYAVQNIRPGWHRLLGGPFGRDGSWLLPAAGLSAALALRRQNPLRAAVVLWGGWWVVLAAFFSAGTYLNSYYTAALAPAVAALCGVGVSLCGPPPWTARVRLTVLAACAACVAYGLYLLHGAAVVPGWIMPAALAVFAVTAAALLLAPARGRRWHMVVPLLACASVLVLPASAAASTVVRGLGPFDTPFETRQVSALTQSFAPRFARLVAFMQVIERQQGGSRILLGVDTSLLAAPYILASGREVQPIGGYLGEDPAPTLATVRSEISHGYVHLFLLPIRPASPDPRLRWIEAHCAKAQVTNPLAPVQYANYRC
jgi:4-amino-4-deoxy-L-arabinose transferase-like glycosyltransferase